MANETKEIIARAILDDDCCGAMRASEIAASILAALDSAGLEIRETFTPTTICADEDQLCPTCGMSLARWANRI